MLFSAWGDESGGNQAVDPGAYMLTATVTGAEHVDSLRHAMEQLRPRNALKVHWHDDDDVRHQLVTEAITGLPIEMVVVLRIAPGDGQEHSRRKCLVRLLYELHQLGCGSLTLESRGRADDRRDRQILDALRNSREPAGSVRMSHEVGPKEPLLWIADAVCGAVVRHRTGDHRYYRQLESKIELVELTP